MMRAIAWSMLIVLFIAGGGVAELSEEQAERLRQAEQQLRTGAAGEAASTLEALIEARPTLAEAHRLLGHARLELDRPDEARSAFVQSIAHGRITADVLGALARIDRDAGRSVAAAAALEGLALLEPDRDDVALSRAQALLEAGAVEASRVVVEALTERSPASVDAWRLRTNLELRAGDTDGAARALTTAYWLGGTDASTARSIGELHHQRGATGAAIAWYRRAVGERDEAPAAWRLRLAELLIAAGRHAEAYERLEAIKGVEGVDAAEVYRWLGHAAQQLGRTAEAASAWEEAIDRGLRNEAVLRYVVAEALKREDQAALARYLPKLEAAGGAGEPSTRLVVMGRLELGEPGAALRAVERHVERAGMTEAVREMLKTITESEGA